MGKSGEASPKAAKETLGRGFGEAQAQQRKLFKTQMPLRRELLGQMMEALRTGGVGAQIPMVRQGVEATKAATSDVLRGLEASPLAASPFGQRIRSQVQTQGALQQARLPVEAAQNLIAGIPGFAGQGAQLAAGISQPFVGAGAGKAAAPREKIQSKMSGFGAGAGALAASDENLKTDIRRVGTSPSGLGIFEFRYKGSPQRFSGPIAQDVQRVQPEAVERLADGMLYVDYTKIDVPIIVLPPEVRDAE